MLVGTGVLVAVAQMRFVVTAAHVADENEWTSLYIGTGRKIVRLLSGPICATAKPNGVRDRDRVDLAIVEPFPETLEKLSSESSFLAPEEFDVRSEELETQYYASGFPGTQTRAHLGTNTAYSKGVIISGKTSSTEKYAEVNANVRSHVVINFDRERVAGTDGSIQKAPEPPGMSGGASGRSTAAAAVSCVRDWRGSASRPRRGC